MSKVKIITISIITFILIVVSVLFGFVFRLRKQYVSFIENEPRTEMTLDITKEQIIESAGLKRGGSIFLLKKEKAIQNIEKVHPFLKVVEIKTKSVTEVVIVVQERHKLLYTTFDNVNDGQTYCYIMDKDLKILLIQKISTQEFKEKKEIGGATFDEYMMEKLGGKYIHILNDSIKINVNTKEYDVLGDKQTQKLISKTYNEIYRYVKIGGRYLNHNKIKELITEINFDIGHTADGNSPYNRMLLSTKYGIVIDIAKPEKDLGKKINTCFVALNKYSENYTSGRIAYYLDSNGVGKYGFFENKA